MDSKMSDDFFRDLCESIVSQQLSVKASDTIFKRFLSLLPNSQLTPENVLKIPHEKLRSCGLSNSKSLYIKDLASKVIDGTVELDKLPAMINEEIIAELIKVKGIGRWTAEMFLMFALARPDIFSAGDLGLRNAIMRLYGLKRIPTEKKLIAIAHKWSPYRTYACRVLWRTLNNTPL